MNRKKTPTDSASRREFVKKGALGAAAMLAGYTPAMAKTPQRKTIVHKPAPATVLGANDRLNIGFIGVGGQGYNAHIGTIDNHGAEFNAAGVAVCDVFNKRRDRAAERLGLTDADTYDDYRALLERDDVDAVFIGAVDHWHSAIATDAMDAGKHVYCEKPMTRYLHEAFDIYDKTMETGKIFQIGSQYCTEGKWHRAAEMIQAGMIGPLVLGQDSYCRNNPDGEWNYGIDEDSSPENIDWASWLGPVSDRPFSADEYHRWRKYYPYCAGILGDLLAHRIHPLMIATGAPEFPVRVASLGTRKVTPDRDVPDNTQVLAEFASGLTLLVIGSTVNEQGLGQVIRGHEGTLYFSGNSIELRPERPFADLVDQQMEENVEPGVSVPAHVENWLTSIRENTQPNGNIDLSIKAQTIICMAEMSDRLGEMLYFDEETRKMTTGGGREIEPITYGTLELS
ncbi:MAG: Gfo/Idh/MocA family oxidoreductase [Bacteroidetes bacterium SB0662_bin_6]|nr:Gfo/Idh/MocA family oxidoreductase [Bacteroidetes bacterium SB0668_bin_1]MYE03377.1 Gfo/Idh/MocA family oxidoreductase [Bacteroidetes bacterium SB0662_bin_6]